MEKKNKLVFKEIITKKFDTPAGLDPATERLIRASWGSSAPRLVLDRESNPEFIQRPFAPTALPIELRGISTLGEGRIRDRPLDDVKNGEG